MTGRGTSTSPWPSRVAWLLAAVAAGCGPATGPGRAVVEIGTGEISFEPLADGQDVPLVAGSQGGHHVWLSVRVHGLPSGRNVTMRIEISRVGEEGSPQRSEIRIDMRENRDGAHELVGFPARIFGPEDFSGRPTLLRVTVSAAGATGSDERVIVPRLALP
ncbi:MAG: hypothetical protein NZ898_13170 [Myxococcota bacterium]|nr:hypothetical protein [Myxococcota bacterium]MDW8363718.1 hypothetical protein [Myxococcales bacterium]